MQPESDQRRGASETVCTTGTVPTARVRLKEQIGERQGAFLEPADDFQCTFAFQAGKRRQESSNLNSILATV